MEYKDEKKLDETNRKIPENVAFPTAISKKSDRIFIHSVKEERESDNKLDGIM